MCWQLVRCCGPIGNDDGLPRAGGRLQVDGRSGLNVSGKRGNVHRSTVGGHIASAKPNTTLISNAEVDNIHNIRTPRERRPTAPHARAPQLPPAVPSTHAPPSSRPGRVRDRRPHRDRRPGRGRGPPHGGCRPRPNDRSDRVRRSGRGRGPLHGVCRPRPNGRAARMPGRRTAPARARQRQRCTAW